MLFELVSETEPGLLLVLVLVIALVGLLIGSIGVGGVLLVPTLSYLADIDIHTAVAAAMFSYLFSGLVGGIMYAIRGSIRLESSLQLCMGAMPGAFLGALAVSRLPAALVTIAVAIFVIFASVNTLHRPRDSDPTTLEGTSAWLGGIGFFVGFFSSITGTGGPLVLVPLLVWLRWPALTAVGLSQLIQLPISIFATLGNLRYGNVDFSLGIGITANMAIGVALGSRLAHSLPTDHLRRIIGVVLASVGMYMTWQSAMQLM